MKEEGDRTEEEHRRIKEEPPSSLQPVAKLNWREGVVDPAEHFYYVWLQVIILPIVYNWVIIILRTCFSSIALSYLPVWLVLDYLCDLMYVADMVITLRTGHLEQGILVTDVSRLKQRYLRSRVFLRDLVSVLPTDLLYMVFGVQTPLVRINRLLRTPRLSEALDRMETRTSYPNTFRISKLMVYIFVLIHWNACLYFALSGFIGFGSDRWVYPNASVPAFASMRRQYFYCFWFSAQIFTTVGDTPLPSREEEYLFMIADLLIAVLVFASIVGNVGNVISSLRDRDHVFFPNHELVKSYLRTHHISKELRTRIDAWYQHLHINQKITRENEILQQLPLHLCNEIAVSVHLPTLSRVSLLSSCETSLLQELVLKLNPQVFSPGEYVCRKGDVGHEMYIIKDGKLAVVADDGVTEYAVLSQGNFFGEISILNIKGNRSGNRRTANIRSIGYSDLFSLSKEDLTSTLSEFPAAMRLLEEKGRQILTKMGMLEESGEGEEGETEEVETRVHRLQENLETLQTKLARLMVEQEASSRRMRRRLEELEEEVSRRRRMRRRVEELEEQEVSRRMDEEAGRGAAAGGQQEDGGAGAGGQQQEDGGAGSGGQQQQDGGAEAGGGHHGGPPWGAGRGEGVREEADQQREEAEGEEEEEVGHRGGQQIQDDRWGGEVPKDGDGQSTKDKESTEGGAGTDEKES